MGNDSANKGFRRHDAVAMDELVTQFIREMKLASGLEKQRAAEAWNAVSGAGRYTLDVRLERGTMTCFISSSVVRNQLYFQRDILLQKLNEVLSKDSLFAGKPEGQIVRNLILR